MATSTTNNGFSQQDLGSNVNRWGDPILNVQLQLIDDALDGFLVLNNPGASIVLTSTNDVTNQARNRVLRLTGTQAADPVITVPNRFHRYWVLNETTGGVFVVGLKTAAQVTPIICKRGAKTLVGCDASNCFQMAPGSLSDLSAATADIDMGNQIGR